jgi:hypothetical protein
VELRAMRNAVHRALRADTKEEERSRAALCADHTAYNRSREAKRAQLQRELSGWGGVIEDELREAGFPAIEPEHLAVPEEESVMSYMLTQLEMELSLKNDYDSVAEATKSMTMEMQQGIREFDETEKRVSQAHARRPCESLLVSVLTLLPALIRIGRGGGRQLVQQAPRDAGAARAGAAHDPHQSSHAHERGLPTVRDATIRILSSCLYRRQ